jgi:hypothetical protein
MNTENTPFCGQNTSRSDAKELQEQPPSPIEPEIECPNFNPASASPVDSGRRLSLNNIALAIDGMIHQGRFHGTC